MKFKRKISKAEYDALAEDIKENYVLEGDTYVLAIEGMHHSERLAEHKKTNDDLKKKLSETEKRFENVDPEQYRTMQTTIDEFTNGKGEKVAEIVKTKTEEQRRTHERLLNEEKAKTAKAEETAKKRYEKLSRQAVKNFVYEHATKAGAAKNALPDIFFRASAVWRYDEETDKVLPYQGEDLWTSDGYAPIAPDKYFGEMLPSEAPHLYESSSGTGSTGAKKNGGGHIRTIKKTDTIGMMKHRKDIDEGKIEVVD